MADKLTAAASSGTASDRALFFLAELRPHRSLSRKGFLVLMGGAAGLSLTVGTIFFLLGAWPIPGFCGLDFLLLYWAFRVSYRRGKLGETIRLDEEALTVHRILPGGRVQLWQFEPYWVRVQMDDPPRRHSELILTSHGRCVVLGSFLTPAERLEVARALRSALRVRDHGINPALMPEPRRC